MQLLLRWAISAGALYATVWILSLFDLARPSAQHWYAWFVAGLIMGLVNALIRPIARLLTAPLNCLTFGLIGIVVNGVMFWLVGTIADAIGMPVFRITLLGAVIGAILVGMIGGLASQVLIREGEED
jgi:putative membrane protein